MHVLFAVLLTVSSVFAYQITYPGGTDGWNTTGPNIVIWERVDTDPLNFTMVLKNDDTNSQVVLNSLVDGTLGSIQASAPSGGWTAGSAFRVDFAQSSNNINALLAQSDEFNITQVSSSSSTTSPASTQTASASSNPSASVSSSDTSTTPTGTSAASLNMDTGAGLLGAVAALTGLVAALF